MKIETSFDYPPVPDRNYDWSAWDSDTYEEGEPLGHGRTKQAAIDDLLNQRLEVILELDGFGTSREELVEIIKNLLDRLENNKVRTNNLLDVFQRLIKFPFNHQGAAEGPLATILHEAKETLSETKRSRERTLHGL